MIGRYEIIRKVTWARRVDQAKSQGLLKSKKRKTKKKVYFKEVHCSLWCTSLVWTGAQNVGADISETLKVGITLTTIETSQLFQKIENYSLLL